MNETAVEVLKALGYPLGTVLTLVVLAYLARQFFQKILESVVARDLEAIKAQNSSDLEQIRKDHNLVLESRKAELAQETERLKTVLSVEAETHRLAARKRFDALLDLWQSSEALLQVTDFRNPESIKNSLYQVNESINHLRKCSVLLSPELLEAVSVYLNNTLKVLTSSEDDLKKNKIDKSKEEVISQLTSSFLSAMVPGAGAVYDMIQPSITKALEKFRFSLADKARAELEKVIREEFGIQNIRQIANSEEEANKSMQPTANASAD